MSVIAPFLARTKIAYLSMEIAIRPEMHTYSGGLGILAGDSARSAADLSLPMVFVTLASRAGYFRQALGANGRQTEKPDWWDPARWCAPLNALVAVEIANQPVWIRPWLYVHKSPIGSEIPILLLDTDVELNAPGDRKLTDQLYGGDDAYRLKQEIVLGIGGQRILQALGFEIQTYHLNEGHAALLTLELLNRHRRSPDAKLRDPLSFDIAAVRERCVFTTHTPVEAGHDRFSHALVERLLPDFIDTSALKQLAGAGELNMTRLALDLSGYVNGVAQRHAETTRKMFPGYRIHAVTNGVHLETWAHKAFAQLFDTHAPGWRSEPENLTRAVELRDEDVLRCHRPAKTELIRRVSRLSGARLDPKAIVIGFARRMTSYKRPLLIFQNVDRLVEIARRHPIQIVFAGKAHPRDNEGKDAIRRIHQIARQLRGKVDCAFLPNYDMQLAKTLVAGVDVWLNNPCPPMEASGTSGMKAALNGVLNLSVLDGWWVEACIDGVTGWAIGAGGAGEAHADALYNRLEETVLPLFYSNAAQWCWMMKQAIANVAPFFNTNRMMRRYASEAYLR